MSTSASSSSALKAPSLGKEDGLFDHIPLMRPWIDEDETEAITAVLKSGWITQGQKAIEFENTVAEFIGNKYAVATNSCTSALHLGLRLSGVGPGDEVICPSYTCMATANAIHMAGAEPLFVDIDPLTYNTDAATTEAALSPRTKAILLVHQIGLPADRDAFVALCSKRGLALIEDAACSFGAKYKGLNLGAVGKAVAYSFHPRKMITTGEGGMLISDDKEMADMARILRSTGASVSDLERHKHKGTLVQQYLDTGYNYRFTDMQAALGLMQMKKLPQMLAERKAQAEYYNQVFAPVEAISGPFVPDYAQHSYSSYIVKVHRDAKVNRDQLLEAMAARGISCRVGIQPLHYEPFYKERMSRLDLPNTEQAARDTIFLPIFPGLPEADLERIASTLVDLVSGKQRV